MEPRGTRYVLEVNPVIPKALVRLSDLANDLWYSWDRPTRELFARLHPGLWNAVGHSPKAFLKRVDQGRLDAAARDPVFLYKFNRVLSTHDTYEGIEAPTGDAHCARQTATTSPISAPNSASTKACRSTRAASASSPADHCKAASDSDLPLTWRRPALSPGLLLADDRRRRQSARQLRGLQFRRACRSSSCAATMAPSCAFASSFPGARWRCACGARAPATSRCACSTPTSRRTASATG